MIALIDYGAGNLTSVRKALSTLGAEFFTPREPRELADARGVIVPGVGHFEATRALDAAWREAMSASLERGASVLGICLGMQWLFEGSDEAPAVPGLGIFRGVCTRLDPHANSPAEPALKVPHVGWNNLQQPHASAIMQGIANDAQVYFTHSYSAPLVPETAAITAYGGRFTAAVQRGRVAGVQFHPEKSGDVGLRILENWLDAL